MKRKLILSLFVAAIGLTSCSVVRPGQVGVKSRFGKLTNKQSSGGLMFYNPFTSSVIKVTTRTINREMSMNLPSKEGLTIRSDVSILYRVEPTAVKTVIKEVGLNFDQIITAVFRSAASDVCSQYFAKDMHSGERRGIENRINDVMNEYLGPRGFVIEAVLLKSITLPPGLSKAIEMKLESEQDALRMEFIKQQESREAERQLIRAEGRKKAQIIEAEANARVLEIEAEANKLANDKLSESLTPNVLKMKQIEAMLELSKSPNTKTLFMDGSNPFMNLLDGR
jgi:regulator of protease activity HflC (stomatin/prohibitin superfamily)